MTRRSIFVVKKRSQQPLEIKPIKFPPGYMDEIRIARDKMIKIAAIPKEILEPLLERQVSSMDYLFWDLK